MRLNYRTLLLISLVLLIIMFFGKVYTSYIPFLVLLVITTAISALNLFLVNHKSLQLRLAIYNTIVLIAFQLWIIYLFVQIKNSTGMGFVRFPLSTVFPIICAILHILVIGMLRKSAAAEDVAATLKKFKKREAKKSKRK